MKGFVLIIGMMLLGVMGWRVGSQISSDAVSMAVGVMFGVLAGVPMALMVLASSRRRQAEDESTNGAGQRGGQGGYYPQPPVIVVTGAPHQGQAHDPRSLPYPHSMPAQTIEGREFRVVGERDEYIDEY
jgi:hypothetical protein